MRESFKDCFAELCADRSGNAIMEASKEVGYGEVVANLYSIRNMMEELVGPKNTKLMTQLLDAYSHKQALDTQAAYEQGMRDGLRLTKIMGGACL